MKENPKQEEKMLEILCNDYSGLLAVNYYTHDVETNGKNIYHRLTNIFECNPKAASLFLSQCGFDGIKYPAGTKCKKPDGSADNAYNYVIFDSNKVKITNKSEV